MMPCLVRMLNSPSLVSGGIMRRVYGGSRISSVLVPEEPTDALRRAVSEVDVVAS